MGGLGGGYAARPRTIRSFVRRWLAVDEGGSAASGGKRSFACLQFLQEMAMADRTITDA